MLIFTDHLHIKCFISKQVTTTLDNTAEDCKHHQITCISSHCTPLLLFGTEVTWCLVFVVQVTMDYINDMPKGLGSSTSMYEYVLWIMLSLQNKLLILLLQEVAERLR